MDLGSCLVWLWCSWQQCFAISWVLMLGPDAGDEVNSICGCVCAEKILDYLEAQEDFTQKILILCYFVNFFNKYCVWEINLA